jgi:DNA-binding response OmpR family regulator
MRRSQRLLIVEDDPNLRRLYKEEFGEEGYEVLVAETGEGALEVARSNPIDGAVLDIRLGGMDGITLMRHLLVARPNLPVVVNTSYTTFKSDFSTWAADRYVVKSSDLGELKAAVHDAIQGRKAA